MSKAGSLLPLIVLVVVLAILAGIGFVVYTIVNEVSNASAKRMEKKNISFSKDGVKVGVKEVTTEQYGDSTQR